MNTYHKYGLIFLALSILFIKIQFLAGCSSIGYSMNIYSQLPSAFWYGSVAIYFLCSILLFSSRKFDLIAKSAIYILAANYILNLSVPYELGYYNYGRADELTHIGEIKNIVNNGIIDSSNTYPATHVIFGCCSLVSGISPSKISFILSAFFSIMFILGLFIYSKLYFKESSFQINSLLICVLLIYYLGFYHFSNVPNYVFFTIVPIFLYLIKRYSSLKEVNISILLLIFAIIIPFGHPFIFLFVVYITIFFVLIYRFQEISGYYGKSLNINENCYKIFIFIIICMFAWYTYNIKNLDTISKIIFAFTNGITMPASALAYANFSKIHLDNIELIKFLILYCGKYFFPLLLIFLLILTNAKKGTLARCKYSAIIIMLFACGTFEMLLLVNPVITHSPDRIANLNFTIFGLIPAFVLSIKENIMNRFNDDYSELITSVIMTIIFATSLFSLLLSPYIFSPNMATTYNEMNGMTWLFSHKDSEPVYDQLGDLGYRYSSFLFGWSATDKRFGKDLLRSNAKLQDHFGYDKNVSFRHFYGYICITTMSELLYETVYISVHRFNQSDFSKFSMDPSIEKLYSSLNINIFRSN